MGQEKSSLAICWMQPCWIITGLQSYQLPQTPKQTGVAIQPVNRPNYTVMLLLRALASRWNQEKFRCYEGKIEESVKGRQSPGIEPRTPGLCSLRSATDLWQPDNHQPSLSSICTAQVGLSIQARCLGFDSQSLLAFSLSSAFAS